MEASFLIIVLTAAAASLLTLLSGFGLGTLLLPVFALFFPIPVAVALTAIVHFLNNIFKSALLWQTIHWQTVLRFGLPGVVGAWLGAQLLFRLDALPFLYPGVDHPVGPVRVVVALLMIAFAIMEIFPLHRISLKHPHLIPGGFISGFFGGLSGHQGAVRSMFLLRSELGKEAYIATGVAIALLVDLTRIPVYLTHWDAALLRSQGSLLLAAVLAAFTGAWAGTRMMSKVSYRGVRTVAASLLFVIAALLLAGVV